MIEILKFIFQDIWHFLGTCILLDIVFSFSLVKYVKDKVNK
jgi:hypothetical protein